MGISLADAQRNPKLAAAITAAYKRKTRKPKNSYKTMKDKAWHEFSRFVRLRDAIATTGNKAVCRCVTCNSLHPTFGGLMQAGHWLGGRAGKNLFDERGCHAQCVKCNYHLHGNNQSYTGVILRKYGQIAMEEMILQGNKPYQYSLTELEEIRDRYKAKADILGAI